MGHLVAQVEDVAQVRPLAEEVDGAAVVLLEHLAQHEDGEELGAGEVLAAVLSGVPEQAFFPASYPAGATFEGDLLVMLMAKNPATTIPKPDIRQRKEEGFDRAG